MSRTPTTLVLAISAILLAALLARQWSADTRWQPGPPRAPDPSVLHTVGKPYMEAKPAGVDPSRIAARPLFSPSRSPRERDNPVEVTEADGSSSITLVGVFQSEHAAGALLSMDGRLVRLALGANTAGLRLEEIHEDAVLLVDAAGGRTEYRLTRLPRNAQPAEVGDETDNETPPDYFWDD